MPFGTIVADPEALVRLTAAFDEAWAEIERLAPVEPLAQAAARERLGYIIVGIWRANPDAALADLAVQAFRAGEVSTVDRQNA
jgi:hypothetical protein